ncbi:MAG: hypothetical protein M1282_02125 [Chloroflexi bacterium]|nr:hypothetical protein [Chloroflexota bacterium]
MTIRTIPLKHKYDQILVPTAPFNFEGTVHKPSHFPSSDNSYKDGKYRFSFLYQGRPLGIVLGNLGTIDKPKIKLTTFSSQKLPVELLDDIRTEIEFRFDLNADLKDFNKICRNDDVLKPVLKRWRGARVSNGNSLYEFLVIATVLQNATVRRSVQMIENLFTRFGKRISFDGESLSTFWTPEAIDSASEEELRALKLGYRATMFKRQAQSFVTGDWDEAQLRLLPSSDLKTKLLELYGIGPASVWYLLFEVFKRYDAFEYISPWEQKIYSRLLFEKDLVEPKVILDEVNKRWGKWKMLAAHYVFEDLFWQRKTQNIPWLEELIRL